MKDSPRCSQVFDLPAAVAFYRDVLGFEMVLGDESWWCKLRFGPMTLMLNTAYEQAERPASPEVQRMRGHADVSLYLGSPDGDEVHTHLRRKGWDATEPAMTSYGMRQVTTRDPDGFQIMFLQSLPTAQIASEAG